MTSYLPYEDNRFPVWRCLEEPRNALRALKVRLRQRLRPQDLSISSMLDRHRSRVSATYLWISLAVPPSAPQSRLSWCQLHTDHVKETISRVASIADPIELGPARAPRAIMLGQCFCNYGDISRDFELESYVEIARSVQQMGYEVLWKEHPRMRWPCEPDLIERVPGVRSLPDTGPWPIEVYAERLGIAACAGLTSTSLFSIPLLFNVPSISPAGRFASRLVFPNDVLARLVGASISQVGSDAA